MASTSPATIAAKAAFVCSMYGMETLTPCRRNAPVASAIHGMANEPDKDAITMVNFSCGGLIVEAAGRLRLDNDPAPMLQLVRAGSGLVGPDQAGWFKQLEDELQNLRSALDWSCQNFSRVEVGLRLAASLWRFWYGHGLLTEAVQYLSDLFA